MGTPDETIWLLAPHTAAKHRIVQRYLAAWLPILGNTFKRVLFIDGFAGPGVYLAGEPGSPVIALQVIADHTLIEPEVRAGFCFIEERVDRADELRRRISSISLPDNCVVEIVQGRFHEQVDAAIDRFCCTCGSGNTPIFVMVDPFGFEGIPFSTISGLLMKPCCEVLVTLMVDSMNRFLEHPNPTIRDEIIDALGDGKAAEMVLSAYGDTRVHNIRDIYLRQLSKYARYVRYFAMHDVTGRLQYLLFFAGNHPLGHMKIKEAMWVVDPSGQFQFSDDADPNQTVLFGPAETQIPILESQLLRKYAGESAVAEEVLEFVAHDTDFLPAHGRAALRNLEDSFKISVALKKQDGTMRRKHTFPDGVLVCFN
jgi:three-Cys-motif partner protein